MDWSEIGDVLAIEVPSDIACEALHYKVVIPSGGKNVSFKAIEEVVDNNEPIDDQVAEHLEDEQAVENDEDPEIDEDHEAESESIA